MAQIHTLQLRAVAGVPLAPCLHIVLPWPCTFEPTSIQVVLMIYCHAVHIKRLTIPKLSKE